MAKKVNPRHGSMQFWPRVRASRSYARVRHTPATKEASPLVFAGYKVGMTHVIGVDAGKTSLTKGEKVSVPVTVVECPPLKIVSARAYKAHGYGDAVSQEIFFSTDKTLSKKTPVAKKIAKDAEELTTEDVTRFTITVHTQPQKTSIGKKTPEVFEVHLGGSVEEQLTFIKEHIGKELSVADVFKVGQTVDVRAVTTGRGYQGPVKRFGIGLRAKKSEKTKRGPGSLGGWIAQAHSMYRIAFAGQTGYHQRTQYSNLIVDIIEDPSKVNAEGGFIKYGEAKNTVVLIKGSIPGPKKRLITMTAPFRSRAVPQTAPTIQHISVASKQGN